LSPELSTRSGTGEFHGAPGPGSHRKSPLPVHPLLFAISPILFLFTYNARKLPLSAAELILPTGIVLAGTLLLWGMFGLVLRNRVKAAIITSAGVLFFFLYGRVLTVLHVPSGEPELTSLVWALLLIATAVVTIRTKRDLGGLTVLLNAIAAAIVLTNVVLGLPSVVRRASSVVRLSSDYGRRTSEDGSAYPDIYYIVLDMHARSDILKQVYGVDNSPFLDFLTAHGFQVARQGRANYAHTYPSLASSLNFEYLDSLARVYGGRTYDEAPLVNAIRNNRLVDILRQHGYSTLVFSSGDAGIALAHQDVLLAPRWNLTEFQSLLLSTTPLPVLLDLVIHKSFYDQRRELVLYALRNLPRAARTRHPVFVFAHILCPHPPFVFGPNGETINPRGTPVFTANDGLQVVSNRSDYLRGYAGQIEFLDRQVEATVSGILAESPSPPVIILQGDHGPESDLDWGHPEPDALVERFAILNAIHLPENAVRPDSGTVSGERLADSVLYDSISPVNTFRVVLNRLFGAGLPLLPDHSFFSGAQSSYLFYDLADSGFRARTKTPADRKPGVAVVAFVGAPAARTSPERYCRRLVALKYEKAPVLRQSYVRPAGDDLSVEQAFEAYRQRVQSGDLPEMGSEYESYTGIGPDRKKVVALFFPVGGKP
jgi:hypothetical protein